MNRYSRYVFTDLTKESVGMTSVCINDFMEL